MFQEYGNRFVRLRDGVGWQVGSGGLSGYTEQLSLPQRLTPPPPIVSSIQIDSENEALLAALTKTLDDIPEDDVGLAAFPGLDEGDTPSCDPASPAPLSAPPSPALERLLSPVSEVDELSMVRTVASGCCQVVVLSVPAQSGSLSASTWLLWRAWSARSRWAFTLPAWTVASGLVLFLF